MEEATPKKGRWARFKESSKDEFQLVIRDNRNYNEVGSYNLTPLNLYVAVSTVLLLLAILVFLLIAYTPLRKYVPGYGDVVQRQEVNALEDTIEELTGQLEAQGLILDNFRNTVAERFTTDEDVEQPAEDVADTEEEPVTLSEAEIQFRREMEQERSGNRTQGVEGTVPAGGSREIPLADINLVAPVNGEISSGFGSRPDHLGVYILAEKNTAIKAAAGGIVVISEFTPANGNVIGIQHDNNLITFYKHNSQLLKQVGDRVRQGEAVAIIGNTGTQSTGPHLHFEMWYRQSPVDPVDYLRF